MEEKLKAFVGKEALLFGQRGLRFGVKIEDVREVFGRTDVYVTPIAGEGKTWVSFDSVKLAKQ